MVGYDTQGFATQSEPFGLHRRRNHLEGFPCAHGVCKQRIAAVEDVRHRISLVFPKLDVYKRQVFLRHKRPKILMF